MKVKKADYGVASSLVEQDYIKKTGLENSDMDTADTVFDPQAELAICPACSTRFKPVSALCPECGLRFG